MGGGRTTPIIPDLFSTESPREQAALVRSPTIPVADSATSSPRHILPSDLPAAIKHLSDEELNQLKTAVAAEQERRGMKPAMPEKAPSKRLEAPAVTLTPGKLSAVRAAFKAGVRPSKIAKQFGIPQADVRKVIASEGKK
ncbi:MAG: hypothetical protein ACXV4B_05115 [Halobacteriota archaeon]